MFHTILRDGSTTVIVLEPRCSSVSDRGIFLGGEDVALTQLKTCWFLGMTQESTSGIDNGKDQSGHRAVMMFAMAQVAKMLLVVDHQIGD